MKDPNHSVMVIIYIKKIDCISAPKAAQSHHLLMSIVSRTLVRSLTNVQDNNEPHVVWTTIDAIHSASVRWRTIPTTTNKKPCNAARCLWPYYAKYLARCWSTHRFCCPHLNLFPSVCVLNACGRQR